MYKIQTFNKISANGLSLFPKTRFTVGNEGGGVDAILVRSADLHEIELEPGLKAIARAGAGTNNIPIDKCTKAGVVVFNTPGANANAVSELVILGLLASSRAVFKGVSWAKTLIGQGAAVPELIEKGKGQFVGPELKGKTIGIVGLGAIGARVADIAIAMGMKVIGYDPFLSVDAAWRLDAHADKAELLDSLISQSDYISLHVPQTPDTKGMVNADLISKMKDGVRVLNFSRGGLVVGKDVIAALDSGKMSCYVTDFADESLLQHDKALCIPHLGASTPEAEENCATMAVEQLVDFLDNGNIVNSVNFPRCKLARSGNFRICITATNELDLAAVTAQIQSIVAMKSQSRADLCYVIVDCKQAQNVDALSGLSGVQSVRTIAD